VVTSSSAQPVLDAARTSTGMFFNRREDKVVERIEQRIAAWTMLAADHSEPIQVLQYEVGVCATLQGAARRSDCLLVGHVGCV
jgi:prolyl 4-hydroxylase